MAMMVAMRERREVREKNQMFQKKGAVAAVSGGSDCGSDGGQDKQAEQVVDEVDEDDEDEGSSEEEMAAPEFGSCPLSAAAFDAALQAWVGPISTIFGVWMGLAQNALN